MCNKAFNTYSSVIRYVPECYKTQEMCGKAVDTCFFFCISFCSRLIFCSRLTYEMYDRVVSKDPFMLIYCHNRYKTQTMCDEAVDDCLAPLKLIPDWFVTSKTLEKFHDALLANDDILFFDSDFSKVTFFTNEKGILGADLGKINLNDDNNFENDEPETMVHVKLLI